MDSSATATVPGLHRGRSEPQGDAGSEDARTKDSVRRGLPGPLPRGEHIVWQGAPCSHPLARQVFHTRLIAVYFAALAAWNVVSSLQDGGSTGDATLAAVLTAGCGAIVIGIFELLAWLGARTTVYTITNRRIVMRIGIAFSSTLDIPFKAIDSVQLKAGSNGVGNISIKLESGARIPYLVMWPHARPWHLRHPQPMLRAVPEVNEVAGALASRLEATARARSGTNVPAERHPVRTSSAPGPADALSPVAAAERRARVPLLGAAGMVVLTLVAVALVQLSGSSSERRAAARTPRTVHDLSFRDLGSDRLAVVDTRLDKTIGIVEPGRDGLVRGALRGLQRVRKLRGLPADAPYQLVIWNNGRMTLSDMGTSRHIPLDSFGPTKTGVLAALLRLKHGGAAPEE